MVSCKWISIVEFPKNIPVKPPEINKLTNPIANNVAGVKRILPLHNVVSQLNTLMADGTAINKVSNTNIEPRNGFRESEEVKLAYDYAIKNSGQHIFLWGTSMGAVAIAKAIADYDIKPAGVILEMPFASMQSHLRARVRSNGFSGFPEKPFAFLVTCWTGIERGYNSFKFKTDKYAAKTN